MKGHQIPTHGFLRSRDIVGSIAPVSRSTLWRWIRDGKFPKPVKLSERVTAWRVEDIRDWLAKSVPVDKIESESDDVLTDKMLAEALGLHSVKDVIEAVSIELLPSPDYIPSDHPGEWLWKRTTVEPYLVEDPAATIRGIFINSTGKRIPRNRKLNALQAELCNVIDEDREALRAWIRASGPMKPMPGPRTDARKALGRRIAALITQTASEAQR